jgi:hypothetical protein
MDAGPGAADVAAFGPENRWDSSGQRRRYGQVADDRDLDERPGTGLSHDAIPDERGGCAGSHRVFEDTERVEVESFELRAANYEPQAIGKSVVLAARGFLRFVSGIHRSEFPMNEFPPA